MNPPMIAVLAVAGFFVFMYLVAKMTSEPTAYAAPAPDPDIAPTPLPEHLVEAASPEARKIATMITKTNPMRWEIESDHCHYSGSPEMSFTYPRAAMREQFGNYYRERYHAGLYMGAKDRDLSGQPVLSGKADEALVMAAVNVVKDRRAAIQRREADEREARAKREADAKRNQFMAEVERRL